MVTGNIRNNYLLTLVQNDGIIDCPLSDDIHPKVVSFINKIMLIFRSGRVQFELNSNSGIFNTMSNEPLVEIEYCLRILYSYFVLLQGGIMIHGAGLSRNGKGYVFFGPSGVGKSTVSNLSLDSKILNDDLTVILCSREGKWKIFSTPFANPGQTTVNLSVPLQGIYLLKQSDQVFLEELSPGIAISEIISNVPVVSSDIYRSDKLFTTCEAIMKAIPFYRLNFRNDRSFWEVIE
jgi:hypothetical protein